MIVAMTNSDEINIVACQVAWTLFGTRTKIARIRSRDYTQPSRTVRVDRRRRRHAAGNGPAGASPSTCSSAPKSCHDVHRAPDPLPGRAAGRRFRRRQGAAGRPARAQGRAARRPGAAQPARAPAERRCTRDRDLPQRPQHQARGRHGGRVGRRSVLRRRDEGHPPRHERDAAARGPGEQRRDRGRRQHRPPARADARGREPGQDDRARSARARGASPSSCATRSC